MKVSILKIDFLLLLHITNIDFFQWTNDSTTNKPICVWNDFQHSRNFIRDNIGGEIYIITCSHEAPRDATYLPSEVYFYQLKTEGFVEIKKMILLQ